MLSRYLQIKWPITSRLQVIYLAVDMFFSFGLVSLILMEYQPLWVIWCKSHPCIRIVVVLFNLQLENNTGFHNFHMSISPKVNVITRERNSVRTRFLRSACYPLRHSAHSAGDAEYTDCISAKELDSSNECPNMTLNNLMMRLQYCCSCREC